LADWLEDRLGIDGLVRALFAMKAHRKAVRRLHPELFWLAVHNITIKET
jgi:hypothetical protein